MAMLEAFVYDPMVSWRVLTNKTDAPAKVHVDGDASAVAKLQQEIAGAGGSGGGAGQGGAGGVGIGQGEGVDANHDEDVVAVLEAGLGEADHSGIMSASGLDLAPMSLENITMSLTGGRSGKNSVSASYMGGSGGGGASKSSAAFSRSPSNLNDAKRRSSSDVLDEPDVPLQENLNTR